MFFDTHEFYRHPRPKIISHAHKGTHPAKEFQFFWQQIKHMNKPLPSVFKTSHCLLYILPSIKNFEIRVVLLSPWYFDFFFNFITASYTLLFTVYDIERFHVTSSLSKIPKIKSHLSFYRHTFFILGFGNFCETFRRLSEVEKTHRFKTWKGVFFHF